MSHVQRDDRPADKALRYEEIAAEIAAVLEGEPNPIARMATVASMLHDAMPTYFWTGFYLVDNPREVSGGKPGELVVGPYQGTLGCLRIRIGQGVCGTAAAERRTVIVEDVNAFDGHIACDSRSNSEIVLPVENALGELIGVFDVDSTSFAAFDAVDAEWLERILRESFAK
ncbi:MAG TPA: GAF domain-containing protein [Caulobacteraceae bacterium]|jgi:GAF domain-containing protein|nr:GAF domain-containing protein [Caulobacteraceae bacterium]